MSIFKEAAIRVLLERKTPLHSKEITKIALEKGYLKTTGKTPEASMNAQLTTETNKLGDKSRFVKTGPSTFALNTVEVQVPPPKKKPKPIAKATTSQSSHTRNGAVKAFAETNNNYIGKAGEHFVISELLFRGFNANSTGVDEGMDIRADKFNKIYSIQVKTANWSDNNSFQFDIRKKAKDRDYAGNVFYVFVMIFDQSSRSCVIMHSNKIEELIHNGAIKENKGQERYKVILKIKGENTYVGNFNNQVNYYRENWDSIK